MTVENDDALKAMAAQVRTMLRAEQGRKWLGSGVTALLVVLVLAALAWWFWPEDKTVHWPCVSTQPMPAMWWCVVAVR